MSPLAAQIGWTLLHFLWSGSLVWMAILGTLRLLDRARPELRHGVAFTGFVALILLPAALFWGLGLQDPEVHQATGGPALEARAADGTEDVAAARSGAGFGSPTPRDPPWVPGLTLIWALGATVMLALLGRGGASTSRLRREAIPVAGEAWRDRIDGLRRRLGITREVGLATSRSIATPLLLGVLRPMILVPPALLAGWTPAEVELVLLHELAHLRRLDNLVGFGQRLAEALLWFHPAVWSLSARLRFEREACCDRTALDLGKGDPLAYAGLLLRLVPGVATAGAAAFTGSDLASRLRKILGKESPMTPMRTLVALAGTVSGIVLLVVAAFTPLLGQEARQLPAVASGGAGAVGSVPPAASPAQEAPPPAPTCPGCPRVATGGTVASTRCTDCHQNPHVESGTLPGWRRDSHQSQDCRSCHAVDPHAKAELPSRSWRSHSLLPLKPRSAPVDPLAAETARLQAELTRTQARLADALRRLDALERRQPGTVK